MKRYFLFFIVFLLSCLSMRPLHIRSIKDNAVFYNNKKVIVRGEVVQVFALPFVDKGFCKIDDGTAEIWVKPAKRVPARGDWITIRGTVKKGITIGEKTFGILVIEE